MTTTRPSFKDIFKEFLLLLKERSTCSTTHQAALLIKDNRILSIGYNGSPEGSAHCENPCKKDSNGSCYKSIHAETNCIGYAARNGIYTENSDLYITQSPCLSCAKLIVASGIKKVFYIEEYRIAEGKEYLEEMGIVLEKL